MFFPIYKDRNINKNKVNVLILVWACIGFRPFVEACIDADEKSEAVKYISKLADPREKAEVFYVRNTCIW